MAFVATEKMTRSGLRESRDEKYKAAIQYYNNKKNIFIDLIQKNAKNAAQMQEDEIIEQILTIDKNNSKYDPIKEGEDKAKKLLEKTIEKIFFDRENKNLKQEYVDKIKDKEAKAAQKALVKLINNRNSDAYNSLIRNEFFRKEINSKNSNRTIGQIAGYIVKRAKDGEVKGREYAGYIGSLKGYYAEQAVNDALNKTLRNIYGAANNKKFSTVIGGKNAISDLMISLEAIAGTKELKVMGSSETIKGFGLQAKPYQFRADGIPYAKDYHVANNADLFHKMPKSFRPHYTETTWFLSRYIKDIIGKDNILYSISNNRLVWTGDLIKNFTENKYYLCFEGVKDTSEGKKRVTYVSTKGISWKIVPGS